jgi:methionine-rich copper-binding protein CopC
MIFCIRESGMLSPRNCSRTLLRLLAAFAALCWFVPARHVQAHAILKESHPAANGQVSGPDLPITLRYNTRIDSKLSKLQLLRPDGTTVDLKIEGQTSADTLSAKATGLIAGAYRLRWQVLAPDGHITRGEVPFTVIGS